MNIAVRQGKPVFDLFSDFKNGKEPFITSIATTYDCPAMCKHCSCEQQKKVSKLLTNNEMVYLDSLKELIAFRLFYLLMDYI
jgi:MoaA/NifB/PqqE/SkfB family radical SAM enzyme